MPAIKHPGITLELERLIRAGRYGRYLPPVRRLAQEFQVSLQTMVTALRPLHERGLILPGPGGTRVLVSSRPEALNVVTAFMLSERDGRVLTEPTRDPLLLTLQEEASKDGVSLVTMVADRAAIFQRARFWEGRGTDGYIFLYSSFYPTIRRHLSVSGVPYVVGNWLPEEILVPWADFDWSAQLIQIARQLSSHGLKRLLYLPEVNWDFGLPYHLDLWSKVCGRFGLANHATPERMKMTPARALRSWRQEGLPPPDAFILHRGVDAEFLAMLDEAGWRSRVVSYAPGFRGHPRVLCIGANDYPRLGRELWKLMRLASQNPESPPAPRLIVGGGSLDEGEFSKESAAPPSFLSNPPSTIGASPS